MWSTVGFIKLQKMEHKVFSAAFKICIFAFTFWVHHVQLLFPLTFNLCTLSLNFLCFVTALSAVCIPRWLICVPGVHAVCTHVFIFQQNRSIFILTVIRHCKQSTFLFSFFFFLLLLSVSYFCLSGYVCATLPDLSFSWSKTKCLVSSGTGPVNFDLMLLLRV